MSITIRRGTTPTIKLKVTGIDVEEIDVCYLTIEQGDYELTKVAEYDEDHFKMELTQEETLAFKKGGVSIQMKIKTKSGDVVATNIVTRPITDILYEEII